MAPIYVGMHLRTNSNRNEFLTLDEVDFAENVAYLKAIIADKMKFEADKLEVIYNGSVLGDEDKLNDILKPEDTVHCFEKTKQCGQYIPRTDISSEESIRATQALFKIIANVQINLNCRMTILQKILAEYPEFRQNLAALMLLRDSVLFNTLHRPSVIKCIAEHHPIIIEAAPFIVNTVKKELARSANNSELTTDSTNSSEDENSLSDRSRDDGANSRNQSESARLRLISRQQLQAALAEIGFGSINSLSNIANSETGIGNSESGSTSLSTSASDERISSSMLRSQLQRAFDSFEQRNSGGGDNSGGSVNNVDIGSTAINHLTNTSDSLGMDIDTLEQQSLDGLSDAVSLMEDGDIPTIYRTHQYAEQLRTMAQMGFLNHEENLTYLNLANGNIENAINLLMAAMN